MSRLSEQNLPARSDADIIGEAARKDAARPKFLKFKKGVYVYEGEEVPLGSEYIAHCLGWVKEWVKFVDGMPVDRKVFPIIQGGIVPERHELPDQDEDLWPVDRVRRTRTDPWSLQFQLPMEQAGGGDLQVFVTSSWGGRQAIANLCDTWSRNAKRTPNCGMPIIRLEKGVLHTRSFGDHPCPDFPIIGWDSERQGVREFTPPEDMGGAAGDDMKDEIPF